MDMDNDMNPNNEQKTNQPGTSRGLRSKLKRPGRRTTILIALILAAAGVAGYLIFKKYDGKQPSTSLPAFSYDAVNESDILRANHLIRGNGQSTGMAFQLPLNGIARPDSPYTGGDERLIPKNRSDVLVVESVRGEFGLRYVGADRSVVFQSLIAGLIVLPPQQNDFSKEDYFKGALNNLSFRLENKDLSKLSLELSGEKAFTNGNISSGAKIYQLRASTPATSKAASSIKSMVGELIEINGKNADYYLLISGTDSVWNTGANTWQSIKNSVKIDQ